MKSIVCDADTMLRVYSILPKVTCLNDYTLFWGRNRHSDTIKSISSHSSTSGTEVCLFNRKSSDLFKETNSLFFMILILYFSIGFVYLLNIFICKFLNCCSISTLILITYNQEYQYKCFVLLCTKAMKDQIYIIDAHCGGLFV